MTVQKSVLKGMRNEVEDAVLGRLREALPSGVKVTVLADRGFADQNLYALLNQLGFDYVVRFRKSIAVTSAEGERRKAADWVPEAGRARKLPQARVTADLAQVGAVVCVKKKGMKEPWCLATSRADLSAAQLIRLYGRRFTIYVPLERAGGGTYQIVPQAPGLAARAARRGGHGAMVISRGSGNSGFRLMTLRTGPEGDR